MLARVIFGLLCVFTGYQIADTGHELYGPYWHASRKVILGPKSLNRISPELTYEDINKHITTALACFMIIGGTFSALNYKRVGCFFLLIAVIMMIATQDNPLVRAQLKPAPKSKNYPWPSLFRHLGLIGGIL